MKRIIALMCAAVTLAAAVSGCAQKTGEVKEDAEKLASEAKNELDDMIADGTVSDGDGYIDESMYPDSTRQDDAERYATDAVDSTDGISTDEGNIKDNDGMPGDSDPTDKSDFV